MGKAVRSVPWAVALALAAGPVRAQCVPGASPPDGACRSTAPRWVGDFASLSGNALIGGLSAGVQRRLHGGSFADAFLRGLIGGGVTYVGKRVAVQRFDGAGLLGRQVAAVGNSMARNAGAAEPLLSTLALPVGPVRLLVQPHARRSLHARLDLSALAWLVYGVAEPRLHFDLSKSLSAGTPVFRTANEEIVVRGDSVHAAGTTFSELVFLSDVPAWGSGFLRTAFAHERVHVLQEDQLFLLVTGPLEDRLAEWVGVPRRITGLLDLDLSTELLLTLNRLSPNHDYRPWELEASFLAR